MGSLLNRWSQYSDIYYTNIHTQISTRYICFSHLFTGKKYSVVIMATYYILNDMIICYVVCSKDWASSLMAFFLRTKYLILLVFIHYVWDYLRCSAFWGNMILIFKMKCFSLFSQVNFIALVCGYQIENKDERYCDVIGKFALLNCRFCSCINMELCLWPPNRYILVLGLITPCIWYKWNSYSSFLKYFKFLLHSHAIKTFCIAYHLVNDFIFIVCIIFVI